MEKKLDVASQEKMPSIREMEEVDSGGTEAHGADSGQENFVLQEKEGTNGGAGEPETIFFEDNQQDLSKEKLKSIVAILAPRFTSLELIGYGGMGVVFKAFDTTAQTVVAVKLLDAKFTKDPVARKRFVQEANSLSLLEHPHIVSIYEHAIANDGTPYLVMQYLSGETLAELLKREKKLEPEAALEIFLNICESLEYAHSRNVIHRDIKPSNIIIERKGADSLPYAHVLDFGIAKMLQGTGDVETSGLTKTGDVFGTPDYMSPEQLQSEDIDRRSDIYSLGCLMYETITGRPPFKADNPIQIAVKHLNEEPRSFASSSGGRIEIALQDIVLKCLKKDRNERYQTISELLRDLQTIRTGEVFEKTAKSRAVKKSEPFFWFYLFIAFSCIYWCFLNQNLFLLVFLWIAACLWRLFHRFRGRF